MYFWIFLILTVLFWGSVPILDKLALNRGATPFQGLVIRSIAVIIAIFIVLFFIFLFTGKFKEVFRVDNKSLLLFAASGILAGLLGVLTYYAALRIGPASKVVPLAATYPLIALLLAVIFLHEHVTLSRIIGTIFVILGIWFLK